MSHETHKTRYSDSSLYDEVCTLCGATDGRGMSALNAPCPRAEIVRDEKGEYVVLGRNEAMKRLLDKSKETK